MWRYVVADLPQWFIDDAREYTRRAAGSRFPYSSKHIFPCVDDRDASPAVDAHYLYADLWAARLIVTRRHPSLHVDVGSRLDGFVTHLLVAGVRVEYVDIRAAAVSIDRLTIRQCDATAMIGYTDESIESLSSLHAVEHFGLGRYGDPIDPDAWLRACRSFARVLAPGGRLYFAVPIGRERVEFNAHRVFAPSTVIETFEANGLCLASFAAVTDDGAFDASSPPTAFDRAIYACGLFEWVKPCT